MLIKYTFGSFSTSELFSFAHDRHVIKDKSSGVKNDVWFKIANITHALPIPVYRQTDFTPKWVVVSRLHDTVAKFRTGVKFSPRCENRGELTPK